MSSQIFRSNLLAGQVAIITGGGSGIGAFIAAELGRLGATLVIASRKKERIEAAAEKLSALLGAEVASARRKSLAAALSQSSTKACSRHSTPST